MSRKAQQGTAEHPADLSGAPSGRFGRLRALPGFRTATVAFILTVVLGIGGTAAYAYWQVSTTATISVTPTVNLPVPAAPVCESLPNEVRIQWQPVAGADVNAAYILTFTVGTASKSYAFPGTPQSVDPNELAGLNAALGGTTGKPLPLTVSLRAAILQTNVQSPTPVAESDILKGTNPVFVPAMTYGAPPGQGEIARYRCG